MQTHLYFSKRSRLDDHIYNLIFKDRMPTLAGKGRQPHTEIIYIMFRYRFEFIYSQTVILWYIAAALTFKNPSSEHTDD